MFKSFTLLIFLTFCCGCSHYDYSTPKYILIAEDVISCAGEKLARKHGLNFCGTYGAMMYNVAGMGLRFQVFRPITREEGREIIVDCILEFLEMINNDEELRPYLSNYPFLLENISIGIMSGNVGTKDEFAPYLAFSMNIKDELLYATAVPEDRFALDEYTETFEEALAIVQSKNKK